MRVVNSVSRCFPYSQGPGLTFTDWQRVRGLQLWSYKIMLSRTPQPGSALLMMAGEDRLEASFTWKQSVCLIFFKILFSPHDVLVLMGTLTGVLKFNNLPDVDSDV